MRVILGLLVLGGCGLYNDDSTDVSGTYVGTATYTIAGSGVDAGEASIDLEGTNDGVDVAIGDACTLSATSIETLTILDNRNSTQFVLSSDSIDASQSCMLPDGNAMTVAVGDLEVDHGGTLTLDVGGATVGSGYIVFEFEGAL